VAGCSVLIFVFAFFGTVILASTMDLTAKIVIVPRVRDKSPSNHSGGASPPNRSSQGPITSPSTSRLQLGSRKRDSSRSAMVASATGQVLPIVARSDVAFSDAELKYGCFLHASTFQVDLMCLGCYRAGKMIWSFLRRVCIRSAWKRCVRYAIMRMRLDGRVDAMRKAAIEKKA
jgi:hypothetical protein